MITIVKVKNPFNPSEGREVERIEFEGYVQDLLEENTIPGVDLLCSVNGTTAKGSDYIKDEDFVVIYPAIEKGGGKNILGIVAAIALSVVAMGAGSAAMGGAFMGSEAVAMTSWTWAGYAAAAAVMAVGSTLMGRMLSPKADMGGYGTEESNPTYGWGGIQTTRGQNNPIPVTYGTVKSGGQVIGVHSTVSGNGEEETLNLLIAAGEGWLDIHDIAINDNPIETYNEVTACIKKGDITQKAIPGFSDVYTPTQCGETLNDKAWKVKRLKGNITDGIDVEIIFPQGLFYAADNGGMETAWVDIAVEYRVQGGSWQSLNTTKANPLDLRMEKSAEKGLWACEVRRENRSEMDVCLTSPSGKRYSGYTRKRNFYSDNERFSGERLPIGPWSFSHRKLKQLRRELHTGAVKHFDISHNELTGHFQNNKSSTLKRHIVARGLEPAEYEVRVRMADCSHDWKKDTRAGVKAVLGSVSAITSKDSFTYPGTALLGIKALATDQLNGSPRVTFIKTREDVWVYSPYEGYVQKSSDNPAWACYDMLHSAICDEETFEFEVRGVRHELIRYDDFEEWAEWCEENDYKVNVEVNQSGELLDVINKNIASIGHGLIVRFGTRYGCIYSHKQEPVMLFGMGNIISGTFTEKFLPVADRANAVEITYTDKDADYQRSTVTVYGETYDTDGYQKTAQLTMNGITSYKQAYREGMYQLECNKRKVRTVSFEAGIDSIACMVGDVVLVAHDVPQWAYSGRIEAVKGLENGKYTVTLPVDSELSQGSYILQYRREDDRITTANVLDIESKEDKTYVTVEVEQEKAPAEGDVFDLALRDKGSKPFVVTSITRSQDFVRRISCIEYDENLYSENYEIPPREYENTSRVDVCKAINLTAKQHLYYAEDGTKKCYMTAQWDVTETGEVTYAVMAYKRTRFDEAQDKALTISEQTRKYENIRGTVVQTGLKHRNASFDTDMGASYVITIVTTKGLTSVASDPLVVAPCSDTAPIPETPKTATIRIGRTAKAEWTPVTNTSLMYYEIRTDTDIGANTEGLLARTSLTEYDGLLLKRRKGTVYVYAVSELGRYSEPCKAEYSKPAPKAPPAPKATAGINAISLSAAFPKDVRALAFYINDDRVESLNPSYTHSCKPGIYDISVAYIDIFGEGEKSPTARCTVDAYIDPDLIAQESISIDKVNKALQGRLDEMEETATMGKVKANQALYHVNKANEKIIEEAGKINYRLALAPSDEQGYKAIKDLYKADTEIKSTIASQKKDLDGKIATNATAIQQTDESLRAYVIEKIGDVDLSSVEEKIAAVDVKADRISSSVSAYKGTNDKRVSAVEQKADGIISTVSEQGKALDGKISANATAIQQTASSIRSEVTNLDRELKSDIKQTADGVSSIVANLNSKDCDYSAITQMKDDINLRVKSDELISQINLSKEGVYVEGKYIHLTGDTVCDNNVVIKGLIAGKALKADKVDAKTLSAVSAVMGNIRTNGDPSGPGIVINGNLLVVKDRQGNGRVFLGEMKV